MRLSLNVGTTALIRGTVDSYESADALLAAVIADPSLVVLVEERGVTVAVRGSAIVAVVQQ